MEERKEMKGPEPLDLSSLNIPTPDGDSSEPPIDLEKIRETVSEAISPRTRLRMRIKYAKNKRSRQRNVNKKS